ncbi:MAG: AtpZ/AtpI family protein [Gemmatimonadota bacterium]|nr:AtpZ/AtpI family protein [Gemmatimonadota bacterium]
MEDEKGLGKTSPPGGLSAADFAGVGIQFAAAIVIFLFAGQWVDGRLGTSGWFTLVGVFVGAGGAFYLTYRKITIAQRRDDAEKLAKRGPGPRDGPR